MSFEVKDVDLAARIGKLKTKSGTIETPTLFPVINPWKYEVRASDVLSVGFDALITNAYIALKHGVDQDIHTFLGVKCPIMTDSGAYQILEYGSIDVDQDTILSQQIKLNTDIGVILDVPSGRSIDYSSAAYCVKETLKRAKEALQVVAENQHIVWVLPIQGGPFSDLVELSARLSRRYSDYFKMYALGSPTVLMERYDYLKLIDMLYHARKFLPRSHPLHLFGAGHPMMLAFAVALGVDTFDSASYILYARDNRYLTPSRTIHLSDLEYLPCSCPICNKHDVRSLKELPKYERVRALALHNLYVIRNEILRIRQAIREGRLWELLEEKARAHPSLRSALGYLAKVTDSLERYDDVSKTSKGVFIVDYTSSSRPEAVRHRLRSYELSTKGAIPHVTALNKKPERSPVKMDTSILSSAFGFIEARVSHVHPLSQREEHPSFEGLKFVEPHLLCHTRSRYMVLVAHPYSIEEAKALRKDLEDKGLLCDIVSST